jgi:hypothetical protein
MLVPSTSDGSQAAVSVPPSLDSKEFVSLHIFTLPEDRCLALLVKNLSRVMPKSVVQKELESVIIRVQDVTQLRFDLRDQDPDKNRLPTPTSLYQWRENLRCRKCDLSPTSAVCECLWNRM